MPGPCDVGVKVADIQVVGILMRQTRENDDKPLDFEGYLPYFQTTPNLLEDVFIQNHCKAWKINERKWIIIHRWFSRKSSVNPGNFPLPGQISGICGPKVWVSLKNRGGPCLTISWQSSKTKRLKRNISRTAPPREGAVPLTS